MSLLRPQQADPVAGESGEPQIARDRHADRRFGANLARTIFGKLLVTVRASKWLILSVVIVHLAAVMVAIGIFWFEERWVPRTAMASEIRRARTLLDRAAARTPMLPKAVEQSAEDLRLLSVRLKSAKDSPAAVKGAAELDQIADTLVATTSRDVSLDLSARESVKRANEVLGELQGEFPRTPARGWRAAFDFLQESLPVLVSWPFIALLVLGYFVLFRGGQRQLEKILSRFDIVKVGVLELTRSADGKQKVEASFADARRSVVADYDLAVQQQRLDRKLETVVEHHLKPYLDDAKYGGGIDDVRCTVHVVDFLLADTLYQLLDYYPEGKGHGRTWSVRFGMIGKVWRSSADKIEGSVSTDREVLIREWGMTRREASARGHDRYSFLGVLLRAENEGPMGLFYADARQEFAFTPRQNTGETDDEYKARKAKCDKELTESINEWCKTEGLTASLLKIQNDRGGRAPLLKIYD